MKHNIQQYFKNGNECLLAVISGSRAYGLNVQSSDLDIRGVFAPPLRDLILMQPKEVIKGDKDSDIVFHSITSFMRQIEKSSPQALEVLFTSNEADVLYEHPIIQDIRNVDGIINKNLCNVYSHLAIGMLHKAFKNDSFNSKYLMHAFRAVYTGITIFENKLSYVPVKLDSYITTLLMSIRSLTQADNALEMDYCKELMVLIDRMKQACDASKYPKEVDKQMLEAIKLHYYFPSTGTDAASLEYDYEAKTSLDACRICGQKPKVSLSCLGYKAKCVAGCNSASAGTVRELSIYWNAKAAIPCRLN